MNVFVDLRSSDVVEQLVLHPSHIHKAARSLDVVVLLYRNLAVRMELL
jgi:hypothetical protein